MMPPWIVFQLPEASVSVYTSYSITDNIFLYSLQSQKKPETQMAC